ncbi:heavy metal translocating P-type ATPase [Aquifex sp.]
MHHHHHHKHLEHGHREEIRHTEHADHLKDIKRRAIVSTILTVPVVLYSETIQKLLGIYPPEFKGSELIPPLLSTVVFLYGGSFFLKGMVEELRKKKPGMMTLVALAVSVAYLYSLYAFFFGGKEFFWELTSLISVMLWGHLIEMKSLLGTGKALEELVKLIPHTAHLVKNGEITEVPVDRLKPGDLVLVKPGEKIPSDGVVVEGQALVDESLLTGESKPVLKKPGSKVIGGSIALDGSLKIQIEKVGEETYLSQVLRLVKEAQESKTRLQNLSDRAAFYLTIIAVSVSVASFILWKLFGYDTRFAVERAVTTMVIACPHALGIAIPLVVSIATSYSARKVILFRNRLALEVAKDVSVVLFDKTGTLTEGRLSISEVITKINPKEFLKAVVSLESFSEHSIGKAIVEYGREKGIPPSEVEDFKAFPGKGVKGKVEDHEVVIGNSGFLKELGVSLDKELLEEAQRLEAQGKSVILVAVDGKLAGIIALSDRIRRESYDAVRKLKEMGKKVVMITGDSERVARAVAKELGIEEFYARVLPHEKAKKVKELQEKGYKVAMVGDGINDAPALTQADVGIAIGAGTQIALESGDVILVKSNPLDVVRIINLSYLTVRKMIQNLFWAVGYNVVAIPLAAGLGVPFGIVLQPAVGAVLMSASTVIVALNATLMRGKLE